MSGPLGGIFLTHTVYTVACSSDSVDYYALCYVLYIFEAYIFTACFFLGSAP